MVDLLGQPTATQRGSTTTIHQKNGVVIYNNGGTTPSHEFSVRQVNNIIGN